MERQRISAEQVWRDLQHLVSNISSGVYHIDKFITVDVDDEHIFFTFDNQKAAVYREDLEDLWNVLRIRGTIRQSDIPQQISDQQISDLSIGASLFQLLTKLSYVKSITLATRKDNEFIREQGLQYSPDYDSNLLLDGEIVI